jgi:hypothetical protein
LSLPGVTRLVTWTILAVMNWCFDCKIMLGKVPTLRVGRVRTFAMGPGSRRGCRTVVETLGDDEGKAKSHAENNQSTVGWSLCSEGPVGVV